MGGGGEAGGGGGGDEGRAMVQTMYIQITFIFHVY